MNIALYEFVTGGGCFAAGAAPPSGSLLVEGRAMMRALTADFLAVEGVQVWTTRDARLPALHPPGCAVTAIASAAEERAWLAGCAARDWTVLIAPETGGALLDRARLVEAAGGRLLSPSSTVVATAGDKHATAALLSSRGIRVPRGVLLTRSVGEGLSRFGLARRGCFPAILKPLDGCGSEGVRLLSSAVELAQIAIDRPMRLEEFVPGTPASAAVLCGPDGLWVLPPAEQRLSNDGRFTYRGGRLPLVGGLAERARRWARSAVAAWPEARGYLGVDLVLGESEDGSGDAVIEINPRLTTSYVGLRALAECNLAAAMLAAANGRAPDLRFRRGPVEFNADGTIVMETAP